MTLLPKRKFSLVGPIESPHKVVQGNPVASVTPIDNPRDRDSLPYDQEPTHVDALGGILGLSKEVTKDVPTSSLGQEITTNQVQDVG